MDQGIISQIKRLSKKLMLRQIISQIEKNSGSVMEMIKELTILDAIRWLSDSWEKVDPSSIEKCFARSGFPESIEFLDEETFETISCAEELQQIEETTGEEMAKDEDLLIMDDNFSGVEEFEDNLDTIIKNVMEEDEEEIEAEVEMIPEIEPPPFSSVMSAIETLKNYSAFHLPEKMEMLLKFQTAVEAKNFTEKLKKQKQKKIDEYFV